MPRTRAEDTLEALLDTRNSNVRGERSQQFHIGRIHARDNRTAFDIGDRHDEGVDSELRSRADAAEELPGAHTDARVDRMNLDTLAAQTRENPSVGTAPTNDFGKHGSRRRD